MAPKKQKSVWTVEEEEILIDLVKINEVLYNAKLKEYRNTELKASIWTGIGEQLKKSGKVKKIPEVKI